MDVSKNDSSPTKGILPEMESVAPHMQDEQHVAECTGADDRTDLSLKVMAELTRRLAFVSEAREAKIRELQDAIKSQTYDVTAEQIADKMLRYILREELT
jgi:anti-sigma28 factor (negative regulator of flagellin synthesis)